MKPISINSLTITLEMLQIIAEIDEFKGSWQLIGRLPTQRLKALYHQATIESIGSSTRIEGAKLSDKEVALLLSHVEITFKSRDEEEVAAYAYTCQEIFNHYQEIPLTENYIQQLHSMLLKYSHKDYRHQGHYKKVPNTIAAFDKSGKTIGIILETSSPFQTSFDMHELVTWTQRMLETNMLHHLLVIGIFVVVFLAIHPFQDGNGRLSRILTTLLLLQNGYSYVPYSSLEKIIEDNKENYYKALYQTQKTLNDESPNWEPWLIFFLRSLQKQKHNLEIKVAHEEIMKKHIHELSVQILQLAHEHGRITITGLVKVLGTNRSTIKKYLAELVKDGSLIKHGKGKATWYTVA